MKRAPKRPKLLAGLPTDDEIEAFMERMLPASGFIPDSVKVSRVGPSDHGEFLAWINGDLGLARRFGPVDLVQALARVEMRGLPSYTLEQAKTDPRVRRAIIAQMRALGSTPPGALPPSDIEIAIVWRAFDDHHASRVVMAGAPRSKNASIEPIAMRLGIPASRVRKILYEHERPTISRNPVDTGKSVTPK